MSDKKLGHPIGYEASTTAKIDLVDGMRVRRRAEKWPIYHILSVGRGVVSCEWAMGNTTCCADLEELQQLAADGKLLVVGEDDGVDRLPHILWRNAKQLVALLENEYGFGQKNKSVLVTGMRVRVPDEDGFYTIGARSMVFHESEEHGLVVCGSGTLRRLEKLWVEGKLDVLGKGYEDQRQEVLPDGRVVTISGKTTVGI